MTKRKKELVELMYEAGIREFPEGGEFAAQDKRSYDVFFYTNKPTEYDELGSWLSKFINVGGWYKLDSLCKNWHRTVVTREQYAEYCKMREQEESSESDEVEIADAANSDERTQPSILDMMRRCNELREVAKQKADQATAAVNAYSNALESLKSSALALGYNIEPIDVSSELPASTEVDKPLNITDWRDLQVGDVIECVTVYKETQQEEDEYSHRHGVECEVFGLHPAALCGQYVRAKFEDGDTLLIKKFKFIRRP